MAFTLRQLTGRNMRLARLISQRPGIVKYLERAVNDGLNGSSQNITEIDTVEAKEAWSVYRLSDGTTLRVKPVMIAVFRAEGQQTTDGEPVYSMKSTLITDVRASAPVLKPA
jgi:hypothetical protein